MYSENPVALWLDPLFTPYIGKKEIRKVSFIFSEITNIKTLIAYLGEIRKQKKWDLRVYLLALVKNERFIKFCMDNKIKLRSSWSFPLIGRLALKIRLASTDVLVDSNRLNFHKSPTFPAMI